jgi:hypothetical protein
MHLRVARVANELCNRSRAVGLVAPHDRRDNPATASLRAISLPTPSDPPVSRATRVSITDLIATGRRFVGPVHQTVEAKLM